MCGMHAQLDAYHNIPYRMHAVESTIVDCSAQCYANPGANVLTMLVHDQSTIFGRAAPLMKLRESARPRKYIRTCGLVRQK